VRGGWFTVGALRKSWEKKYKEGAEVKVESSVGFILNIGFAKP
jgi:hypothetical protein